MRIRSMSKGMKEKLQISLTMAREAEVYLFDEPISGVDPAARDITLKAVLNNYSDDSLVIMSTHLVHDLESIIDYAVFMKDGRVVESGDTDDFRMRHNMSLDQIFIKEYASWVR